MIREKLNIGDLIEVTTSGKCFLITGQNERGFYCQLTHSDRAKLVPYSECMRRYSTGIWVVSRHKKEPKCK